MRRLLFCMAAAACLLSCRTQKIGTTTGKSSEASYVDTTKTVTDSARYTQTDTDTTRTSATYEGVGVIDFVETGGKVSIDTAGNITFEGVRNIRGRCTGTAAQEKGSAHNIEQTAGHLEQSKGVAADHSRSEKRTEETPPTPKWCNSIFARIGQAVCLALLLWLLFLYLKRKR